MRPPLRISPWLLAVIACASASVIASSAHGATSNLVVSMSVQSSTSITPGTCVSGTAGITDFGTVLPGTNYVGGRCDITFGSTNDTAQLQLTQQDGRGIGMWSPGTGTLDPTFGGGSGYATVDAGTAEYPNTLALQSTGKIVTAGYGAQGAVRELAITRFTTSGATDATFGTTAPNMTYLDVGTSENLDGIVVLPDDSILAGGGVDQGGGTMDLVLVKLDANGVPDASFGPGGVRIYAPSAGDDDIWDMTLQPDGKVVAVGEQNGDLAIWRFLQDGSLDTSFGVAGSRVVDVGVGDGLNGVALQSDGTIVAAGSGTVAGTARSILIRVSSSGTVLSNASTLVNAANTFSYQLVVAPDDTIYATGTSQTGASAKDFMLLRYTAAGALDTTWGTSGVSQYPITAGAANDSALSIVRLPDGRLLMTGFTVSGGNKWAAIRVLPDGSLDPTFGTGGKQAWTTLAGTTARSRLGIDGRVAFVGSISSDTGVMRLESATIDDYANLGGGGDTDWSSAATTSTFGACLESATGANVAATWTATGSCSISDSDPWYPVATTSAGATAKVARTTSPGASGVARVHFGVRPAAGQRPGSYVAPVTFSVLAPG